jgi:hypothetical protein
MTAPERFAEKSDSLLHRGRRPYMARMAWALLAKGGTYRAPALAAAA